MPVIVEETPCEDLKALYSVFVQMQQLCVVSKGVGLAAVQVGLPWHLFICQDAKEVFRYFINCYYEPTNEEQITTVEGCLSICNSDGIARRFRKIRHKCIKLIGKELISNDLNELKLIDINETHDGFMAIVLQHEIDHGNGLTIDSGEEVFFY